MSTRAASLLLGVASAAGIFVLDQLAKARWFVTPDAPAGFWYLNGWIQSVVHKNYGITFNLPLPTAATLIITVVALCWVLRELHTSWKRSDVYSCILLGLIIGGALGNAYDRAVLHYVRDWLLLWHLSAVNLADGSILVGAIGYLYRRGAASRRVASS